MEYGFSTSVTSATALDAVMDAMKQYNCDTLRFAMNNTTIQSGTRPYLPNLIKQYLDTSDYIAISDPNHTYPPGTVPKEHITDIINRCKVVADLFGDYGDRFIIEPFNEYNGADLQTVTEQIVTALRAYGYTGVILYNLLPGSGPTSPLVFNDDMVAGGTHYYFNTVSVSTVLALAKKFSDKGIRCINTEIGANWNETDSFTTTNVQKVVDYFQLAYDQGKRLDGNRKIVNLLWMNHNIDNLR